MKYPMGLGIGGYNLNSNADKAFAFDYDSSGKMDHIVLYRPGKGAIFIVKFDKQNLTKIDGNTFGLAFTAVYQQGDPGSGIGGYSLNSADDRAFAYDYDSSGKMDHLVFYRPGTGTVVILKNTNGVFTSVYQGNGIGGYNLSKAADMGFAYDYDSSGKMDHLVFFRPGQGAIFILKRVGTNFTPVFQKGDPGPGIGGYNLKSTADRAFAYDYDSSGKLDHLVFYRPGQGAIFILKRVGSNFTPVFQQGDPGQGIGGFNLSKTADQAFAFDFDSSGKMDHLVFYRHGQGAIFVLKRINNDFVALYEQPDPGSGIGGYPLDSTNDNGFAFDFNSIGKLNFMVFIRPGAGIYGIISSDRSLFTLINTLTPPFEPFNLTINSGDVKNTAINRFVPQGAVFAWADQAADTSIAAVGWRVTFRQGQIENPVYDPLSKTTVIPSLGANQDYIWNVRAFNAAGWSTVASANIHVSALPLVPPSISVTRDQNGRLFVHGTGFLPSHPVSLIYTLKPLITSWQTTSDATGTITFQLPSDICTLNTAGFPLLVWATDDRQNPASASNPEGEQLYSNRAPVPC